MKQKHKTGQCLYCDDCEYIGDGDYACIAEGIPKIVVTEFSLPTNDYGECPKEETNA